MTKCLPMTVERLMAKSHIDENGCFVWDGWKAGSGYGKIGYNGSSIYVHRASWTIHHGPIPDGLWVDHSCFNIACWNIDHLRLATPSQNGQYRSKSASSSETGFRGVARDGSSKTKWRAFVTASGVRHFVYGIDSPEDAAEVARRMRLALHSRATPEDLIGPVPNSRVPDEWDPFRSGRVRTRLDPKMG